MLSITWLDEISTVLSFSMAGPLFLTMMGFMKEKPVVYPMLSDFPRFDDFSAMHVLFDVFVSFWREKASLKFSELSVSALTLIPP